MIILETTLGIGSHAYGFFFSMNFWNQSKTNWAVPESVFLFFNLHHMDNMDEKWIN